MDDRSGDQLEAAVQYTQQDDPDAARSVAQAVIDRIEQLVALPRLGRPGQMSGTRELVSPPYVVVYRLTEEIVEVLYIWHGAQDWR